MTERMFPIIWPDRRASRQFWEALGCPTSVPWAMLAPHERQARENHDQSLQRLAERGGLSPCEMLAVLEDRRWRGMPDTEAVPALVEAVRAWRETHAARELFEDYRGGWLCGALGFTVNGDPHVRPGGPDALRGYADGLAAYRTAMAAERERRGLPAPPVELHPEPEPFVSRKREGGAR